MRRDQKWRHPLRTMRPTIPLPCTMSIACVVGIFLGGMFIGGVDQTVARMMVVCGSFAALVLLALAFVKHDRLILWFLVFLIIGFLLCAVQLLLLEKVRSEIPHTNEHYVFTLCEDAKESTYGSQLIATISEGSSVGKRVLLFTDKKADLYNGDQIEADCLLSVPDEEYQSYYDQRDIALSGRVNTYQVSENDTPLAPLYQLRKGLLATIGKGSDEQTLLRAILLGERSTLFDADFYHSIKVAGLAHLVAVSGAHLVIVTGFVTLVLRKLRIPRRLSIAIQTLFLVSYVVLVGFPLSCIRAALMSGVTLFALLAKRRSSSLSALGITVLLMVAFDPCVVYSLSFQLSVSATLGIVVFMPLFNEWFHELLPVVPTFARESICMTLAALLFSLPLSVAQFALVPLLSPLANLIVTPYLSFLLILGFGSLLLAPCLPLLLSLLSCATKGLIWFFAAFESIPFASIPFSTTLDLAFPLALALAALLWVWWPSPTNSKRVVLGGMAALSVIVLVCGVCFKIAPEGDRIVMLNVGQGDSFAFVSEGKTLLVDTGKEPEMLYASLARNHISKIDAVLITHPDDDHCGSLQALSGVVAVDRVLIAEGLDEVDDKKAQAFLAQARKVAGERAIREVNQDDTIHMGIFTFKVIAPVKVEHDGGNEDSICFNVEVDCDRDGTTDWKGFFCGDAEAHVLESLDEKHLLEQVDLYKVGHHGSRKAITSELARILHPKVSLIGVGENSYGHPTDEALSCLEEVGSQIYRSDQDGDVVCTFSLDGITVHTQNR